MKNQPWSLVRIIQESQARPAYGPGAFRARDLRYVLFESYAARDSLLAHLDDISYLEHPRT